MPPRKRKPGSVFTASKARTGAREAPGKLSPTRSLQICGANISVAQGKLHPQYGQAVKVARWMMRGGWNLKAAEKTKVAPAQDLIRFATGVAVVLAESGGAPRPKDNVNKDGSRDRGLWQINDRWHKEVSDKCAYDPVCASKAALRISNYGSDFSQWTTYTTKAYCAKKNVAAAATYAVAKQKFDTIAAEVLKGDLSLEGFFGFLRALFDPRNWLRFFQGVGGAVVILAAIVLVAADAWKSPKAQRVVRRTKDVTRPVTRRRQEREGRQAEREAEKEEREHEREGVGPKATYRKAMQRERQERAREAARGRGLRVNPRSQRVEEE